MWNKYIFYFFERIRIDIPCDLLCHGCADDSHEMTILIFSEKKLKE